MKAPPIPWQQSVSGFPVTAFVLAGGRSSRMGQDKAFIKLDDAYLIEYPIRVLRQLTNDVRIIGDPNKYAFLGLPVTADCGESKGPLTGIYTALRTSSTLSNLVLACDMPLISLEYFQLLLKKAPPADVVAMRFDDGFLEPLCSIYSTTCLKAIEQNLQRQEYKISELLKRVRVSYVSEAEIGCLGLSREIFTNVNTPEEFGRVSLRIHSRL
jgi:molybdopterin-guanine dinucleotide biosynthesis protein A